ncbi:MAG: hypothetical protein BWY08_01171 [Bacteroidetes bacterium ADurb.Bin174]|mgnify:CR=1 FL=1|nr:MAG: hypothetical protein BWY08_01171 [Bacteroidetes bacterium ADurb.Bin174]
MKKILPAIALFVGVLTVQSQSDFALKSDVPSHVYALPKTGLCFEIEVETITEKPGIFYLYSQRYLATNEVIMEEKISSSITDIKMNILTAPDMNRRYVIEYSPKSPVAFGMAVNEQGILCGVNVPAVPTGKKCEIKANALTKKEKQLSYQDLLPLTQEHMMAGSAAKMAEGAAKQIYTIRESRLNLLMGEVDHMPEGEALKIILQELDVREKKLSELFVGSVQKETGKYTITLYPEEVLSEEVLFRLSAKRGVISKEDLSGEPYYISIIPETISKEAETTKSKSKKLEKVGLYTILPAATTVTISDGVNTLFQRDVAMPQFGELIPLPESLVHTPNIKISIDPQSGRLLKIEK